jgi:GDP/GTP exchange factor required for growth at low temperature
MHLLIFSTVYAHGHNVQKLYERGSFNTLVSIIAGLKNDWVTKAMRKSWSRVGIWETRMFRDLVAVTSPEADFKFLRQEVDATIEAKPITVGPHEAAMVSNDGQSSSMSRKAAGDGKVQPRSGCIPFLGVFCHFLLYDVPLIPIRAGIYLSQLHRHCHLPDLIDPTAPTEPVGIDPITNAFDAPAHPQVFSTLSPLPHSMQLEPLINVQKQRLIAGVIKSLVTGQHLASTMQFPVDKKLFQKCLKLKALDQDTLQRAYAMYPD